MFGVLFLKECRQVLRSLVFYIYVAVFILFMTSQMSSDDSNALEEPQPGQSYYGIIATEDETLIMEETLSNLVQDVSRSSFAAYPFGFYKEVTLTDSEKEQAEEIVERCTGKSFKSLEEERWQHFEKYDQRTEQGIMAAMADYKVSVKEGFTYDEFKTAMEEICRIVGKGSSYEKSRYENATYVPMTYEQAKEEFDALCSKDRVTQAYMRLFCDYAGIVLAILPIFVGVSRALRDKRAKAQQVIFSTPVSGAVVVGSRYLANVAMVSIPVIVTAFLLQQPYYYKAQTFGVQGDMFAFLKVPSLWLVPEIMIVLAVSFLITELTDNILAVFVQAAWAIGSLFGANTLVGGFGLKLITRWNTLGQNTLYVSLEKELLRNKTYYCFLAVACIVLAMVVYERKRRRA